MYPVLKYDQSKYYQTTVGQLRWVLELGRIDTNLEINLLSLYLDQPRRGNLDKVFHTLSFLKSHGKRKLLLDTFNNDFDGKFTAHDWEELYSEAQEYFSENAPEERGESATMTQFVDADYAGNIMNHLSHTGIIIYLCRALMIWYNKNHNTVESSMFG